jgi:lambda repressor-like predicted transcriptional regulator
MSLARTDEMYIVMGKIVEKKRELKDLENTLYSLETQQIIDSSLQVERSVAWPQVPVVEPVVEPVAEEPSQEEIHTISVSLIDVERAPITETTALRIMDGDAHHAAQVSSGKYKKVRWGSEHFIPQWTGGRKHDPTNSRIANLRAELRRGPKSIRELSSTTGLALNTVKDIVREMDKQGFFL